VYFVSTLRRDVWSEKEIGTKINTVQIMAYFTSKIQFQAPSFWPRNVVKRSVCYQNVCSSVCHTRDPRLNGSRYRDTF